MPTWNELKIESKSSAGELFKRKYYRSSVSRSYYAAYAAITSALLSKGSVVFLSSKEGPAHTDVTRRYDYSILLGLPSKKCDRIKSALNKLYGLRIVADYRPSAEVTSGEARMALALMNNIIDEI